MVEKDEGKKAASHYVSCGLFSTPFPKPPHLVLLAERGVPKRGRDGG